MAVLRSQPRDPAVSPDITLGEIMGRHQKPQSGSLKFRTPEEPNDQ